MRGLVGWVLLLGAGCGSAADRGDPVEDSADPDDTDLPPSGDDDDDDTGEGPDDPPGCEEVAVADLLRQSTVSIDGALGARAELAASPSGSVVAWAAGGGEVRITPLGPDDQRAGDDLVVPGTGVYGLVAGADDIAVLVSRAPDYMTFVRLDHEGNLLATADLVGGGDHAEVGTEWFGNFAETGRLAAAGDGRWAAYFALHRLWPDLIGHQGDTLKVLDEDGAVVGGWGWGCSHSMDQRIARSGEVLGPICISDCYPTKGILFNWQGAVIETDPDANCAGGHTTSLGGLVGLADGEGFWLSYGKRDGTTWPMTLVRLGADGSTEDTVALPETSDGVGKLAALGDGLLAAWREGGEVVLQRLDAEGAMVGDAETFGGLGLPVQDLVGFPDGSVGWARASGASLEVVRVEACAGGR